MHKRWAWVAGVAGGVLLRCGGSGDPNKFQFEQPSSPSGVSPSPSGPACYPRTCQDFAATCGSVADGCGGTLQCGSCAEGQSCGGAGVANQCGAPALSPAPALSWVVHSVEVGELGHAALATDERGAIYLSTWGGADRLSKYDPSGKRL